MASRGRVLHLSENLTLPFDRRVWMELNALKAAGWQVTAICPVGEPHTARSEVLDGIHILRYPAPPPDHHGRRAPAQSNGPALDGGRAGGRGVIFPLTPPLRRC